MLIASRENILYNEKPISTRPVNIDKVNAAEDRGLSTRIENKILTFTNRREKVMSRTAMVRGLVTLFILPTGASFILSFFLPSYFVYHIQTRKHMT